jgi:hypothetical protein
MRVSLKSVIAGLALGAIGLSASAAGVEYGNPISTAAAGVTVTGSNGLPGVGGPIASFNFGASATAFTGIDSLTLTLRVTDGDSGALQFDRDNLTIGLNGLNTGIKLNDFLGTSSLTDPSGPVVTQDITGAPANAAAILALIKTTGLANLTVFDSDVDTAGSAPGAIAGDQIGFPQPALLADATLIINNGALSTSADAPQSGDSFAQVVGVSAVPLPLAAYLAPFGAGLAGIYSRRFRRQK